MIKKLFLLFSVLMLGGCSIFPKSNNSIEYSIIKDKIEIEYGGTFDANEYLWGNYDSVTLVDESVTLNKVGELEIEVMLLKGSKSEIVKLKVSIIDTQFPVFEKAVEKLSILEGEEVDLKTYFKAVDVIDGTLRVYSKEKIDTSKIGVTDYQVIAEDKNGNKTTTTLSLEVKKKEVEKKPDDKETPIITPSLVKPPTNAPSGGSGQGEANTPHEATPPPADQEKAFIGVSNITIAQGSSTASLQMKLTQNVSLNHSGSYSVNYANVNLSVKGSYTVIYTSNTGITASCIVTVI